MFNVYCYSSEGNDFRSYWCIQMCTTSWNPLPRTSRRRQPIDSDLAALATGGIEAPRDPPASRSRNRRLHRRLLRFNGPIRQLPLQIYPGQFYGSCHR